MPHATAPPAADIEPRVCAAIARAVPLERARVVTSASFEQLGVDSLDVANIAFALEEEFAIRLPDDLPLGELAGVADAVAVVRRFLATGTDDDALPLAS